MATWGRRTWKRANMPDSLCRPELCVTCAGRWSSRRAELGRCLWARRTRKKERKKLFRNCEQLKNGPRTSRRTILGDGLFPAWNKQTADTDVAGQKAYEEKERQDWGIWAFFIRNVFSAFFCLFCFCAIAGVFNNSSPTGTAAPTYHGGPIKLAATPFVLHGVYSPCMNVGNGIGRPRIDCRLVSGNVTCRVRPPPHLPVEMRICSFFGAFFCRPEGGNGIKKPKAKQYKVGL